MRVRPSGAGRSRTIPVVRGVSRGLASGQLGTGSGDLHPFGTAMTPSLQQLQRHYDSMPPVAVMQLAIDGYADHRLRLRAPLSRHVNDKGCAFGGSLASLMTLAGWGLVWLELEAAGLEADIYVADSRIRYLAPLYDDLQVTASAAPDADWPGFVAPRRERGRARIELVANVPLPDGRIATDFTGRYVAIARPLAAAAAGG